MYRYVNHEGNKVVAQSVPAKYVRNGYEVLNMRGDLLKVVPAAPPEADAESAAKAKKAAKEQALLDAKLRQIYSSLSDIDSAKKRSLQELANTIEILQGNLSSLQSQLKAQEAHAASIERSGRVLTDAELKAITTLKDQEASLKAQIKQRETEYQAAELQFEQDRLRFIEITRTAK